MTERQDDDKLNYDKKVDNSTYSEEKHKIKFKDRLKGIIFIGKQRRTKLLNKYGDFIEEAMTNIEKTQNLERFLKNELGSYFQKIRGAWNQYKEGEIGKTGLISSGVIVLRKKFIDIFLHESRAVLMERKRHVYLTLSTAFLSIFAFCMLYFLMLMPVDITDKPEGNFIFPGNEKDEWIFTMIMALIAILSFGYLASLLLPRITVRIYTKSIKKNRKLGLVPIENPFGSALYRKLLFRAMIIGFLTFNLSYTLSAQKIIVEFMRSVNPEGTDLIPDPELMIQIMWIVAIPCTLILVPIWLMMDIGLARTRKERGVEFESVNLTGSKFYKYIKGYAGIGFVYNLFLITFVWASDDVPPIRVIMRVVSPIIVISFMLPLVVLIDYNNEHFKRKLWEKLKKYEINKKLKITIEEKIVETYEEILNF